MIRVAVSPRAYHASKRTLPKGAVAPKPERDQQGAVSPLPRRGHGEQPERAATDRREHERRDHEAVGEGQALILYPQGDRARREPCPRSPRWPMPPMNRSPNARSYWIVAASMFITYETSCRFMSSLTNTMMPPRPDADL